MGGRPAGMSVPSGRVTSRSRWRASGLAAMIADQGLGVGLRQPLGLLAAAEPSQHLSSPPTRADHGGVDWRAMRRPLRGPLLPGDTRRSRGPAKPSSIIARIWGLRGCSVYCEMHTAGRLANERRMVRTPFARLSLASARYLVEDAVGRLAGNRKTDRGPAE
jgi:hypothetical protein